MSIDNWVLLTGASSANSRYMSRPSTKHVDLSRCFYFWLDSRIIPWWLTQNSNSKVVLSLGLSIHSVTTQRAWKIQSVHPFHQNSMGARWSCLQCSISDVPLAIHCILISMKQLITFDCELSLISNVLLLFFLLLRWDEAIFESIVVPLNSRCGWYYLWEMLPLQRCFHYFRFDFWMTAEVSRHTILRLVSSMPFWDRCYVR